MIITDQWSSIISYLKNRRDKNNLYSFDTPNKYTNDYIKYLLFICNIFIVVCKLILNLKLKNNIIIIIVSFIVKQILISRSLHNFNQNNNILMSK